MQSFGYIQIAIMEFLLVNGRYFSSYVGGIIHYFQISENKMAWLCSAVLIVNKCTNVLLIFFIFVK